MTTSEVRIPSDIEHTCWRATQYHYGDVASLPPSGEATCPACAYKRDFADGFRAGQAQEGEVYTGGRMETGVWFEGEPPSRQAVDVGPGL